jgi:hypothetical protein
MTSSTRGRTMVVGAILAVFMGWQLLVPALMLFAERPARYGWQMYSALPDLPRAWRIDSAGHEWEVEVASVFAEPRAEIHYSAVLRAGICELPDTVAMKLAERADSSPELIDCQ